MYGTQAACVIINNNLMFENDVKMYGTQAVPDNTGVTLSLRMM